MSPDLPADLFARDRERREAARTIPWEWTPHEGQQRVLDSRKRFKAVACGRRWGKTITAARIAIEQALATQDLVWWAAPTYKTAMRGGWKELLSALPRDYRVVQKSERQIELVGGGVVEVVSCDDPDNLRGAGLAALVVDEAAYVPDYVYQDVLRPMLAKSQGPVIAISTPKRKRGWFYELFRRGQAGDEDVASFQMPTSTNPHIPTEEIASARKELPESVFRREWLAMFLDELGAVFPSIRQVATLLAPDLFPEADYYIGVDWGRSIDFTVLSVWRDWGDGRGKQVWLDRFTGLRYSEQLDRVRACFNQFQPRGILAEVNNMGEPLVELLQDEGYPVAGFRTTGQSKAPLIRQLQLAVEQQHVELLADERQIIEFEDFEETDTATGHTVFGAADGKIEGDDRRHDDTVIAAALAWRQIAGAPGGERGGRFEGDPEQYLVRENIAPAVSESSWWQRMFGRRR